MALKYYMIEFIIFLSAVVMIFSIIAYFYYQREVEILILQEKLADQKEIFHQRTMKMVRELHEAKAKQEEYHLKLRQAHWGTPSKIDDITKVSEK